MRARLVQLRAARSAHWRAGGRHPAGQQQASSRSNSLVGVRAVLSGIARATIRGVGLVAQALVDKTQQRTNGAPERETRRIGLLELVSEVHVILQTRNHHRHKQTGPDQSGS